MSKLIMQMIGNKTIEAITQRIEAGKDIDGKAFRYSVNPFAMPKGAMLKKAQNKLMAKSKALVKKGEKGLFFENKKTGGLWATIPGGYKQFREISDRSSSGDFLQFTGRMLASVKIIKVTDDEVVIGFGDKRSAELAFYQNVSGVGKSRKLWKWFGLNPAETDKIAKEIQTIV